MNHTHSKQIQHLADLIRGLPVAMLTTVGTDGSLHCRPMASSPREFDGTLWFYTSANSPKVGEVLQEAHVNVSYADPAQQRYVSISGRAALIRDRKKLETLWSPAMKTWFPRELADPQLALLRVAVESWEYWDAQAAGVVEYARSSAVPSQ